MRPGTSHDSYLEELILRLDEVGECRKNVEWIMVDGIYMQERGNGQLKLADLLIGCYDSTAAAIELKSVGSKNRTAKVEHAMEQLWSAERLLCGTFGYHPSMVRLKIAYYDRFNSDYTVESVNGRMAR